jgi:PAS domain S-box-containing protein
VNHGDKFYGNVTSPSKVAKSGFAAEGAARDFRSGGMDYILKHYAQLFDNAPIGLYVEQARKFVYVNQNFIQLTGFSLSELKSNRPLDYVVPEDRAFVQQRVVLMLKGELHSPFEFRVRIKSGEIRWIMQTVAPIKYKNRPALMGYYMDITDMKKKDEELKVSRERLRNLSRHLQTVRERERTRIAQEVHDELGQILTALKLDISSLLQKGAAEKQMSTSRLKSVLELLDQAIKTVQRISTELRPSVLTHLGLEAAIEWQSQQFTQRTGIPCETLLCHENAVQNADLSTALFRILQEALTNVARHAGATKVNVALKKQDNSILLDVEDNGRGITKEEINRPTSVGLLGIQERVNSFGGTLEITGRDHEGTALAVTIPLPRRKKAYVKSTDR